MSTTYAPGTPCWVDIGSTDLPGTKEFYRALFGWEIEDLGPMAGGYGIIRQGGRQVGGIGPATDPDRGTSWTVYFATTDAAGAAARAHTYGGGALAEPMDVMDLGRTAVLTDPGGVPFAVWQAGRHVGAEIVDEHGSLTWAELETADLAAAKAFYPPVLGVTTRDLHLDWGPYTLLVVGGRNVAGAMEMGRGTPEIRPHWHVYFAVDDCDRAADRAIELGAVQHLRHDAPAGRLAAFTDPQGARFSIITNTPDFSP